MMEGSRPAGERFVAQTGLTAPVILGTPYLAAAYHMQVYPWTVIIDREGKARKALRGGHSAAQLRKVFAELL
jgi:hypothetical protein